MVTGNGTCSSWHHQSLPCWLYTVVSTQTLPWLPTAPAASTCCPCAGTGWQRHNEPATALSPSLWPRGSVRSYKKLSFLIGGRGKASHAVRMVRASHSQSCWRVRKTEDQGQNLLQFEEQCRRDHEGVPSTQKTAQFYIILFIMPCI